VAELTADTGSVSGAWSDCGTADQFDYTCKGKNCTSTGAINSWPCADPGFIYEGDDTGFEYAYAFVAPSDGVCTLIEHGEGFNPPGPGNDLFGVIDWFILTGGGGCEAGACIAYMWENTTDAPECGPNETCSTKSFAVTEGQLFYIVADIFDGVGTNAGYEFEPTWDIEIQCDATEQLLLDEDFTDSVCDGCSASVDAPGACQDFGWHAIGGFADVVTGYYLGQLVNGSLVGYDCGATSATLSMPSAALPADATSCTLSLDYYAQLDPADDGDCVNDIFSVFVADGGGPATQLAGDACGSGTASENPIGSSATPAQTMTWDLSWAAGSNVTVELHWSSDAANNAGLGVVIDNVRLTCLMP